MIITLGLWSRLLARRVGSSTLRQSLRYFNRVMFGAQIFVPVWFATGVFGLDWGDVVHRLIGPLRDWPVQLPGAVIGTIPALLAWMGLWWSQYPADRALREQNLLSRLDQDLAVYTSPPFKHYARQNFRLQILFSAIPILMILALHDLAMIVLWKGFKLNIQGSAIEGIVTLSSAITVFVVVPVILYRILGARSLPQSALRGRMEAMCRQHNLTFRDILLWPTHNRVANALVMGVAPRFRYVLLSDLLSRLLSKDPSHFQLFRWLFDAISRALVFTCLSKTIKVAVSHSVSLENRLYTSVCISVKYEPNSASLQDSNFAIMLNYSIFYLLICYNLTLH